MSSLGSVSIAASGSDANGRWVRWADGTQICWSSSLSLTADATSAAGSLYQSTEQTWTLPGGGFIDTNYAVTGTNLGSVVSHFCVGRHDTTTAAKFAVWAPTSISGRPVRLMAVGRWY